ncbi:MAG: hypothetical protein ACLR13_06315 [Acutalibacteraceae bacterium]
MMRIMLDECGYGWDAREYCNLHHCLHQPYGYGGSVGGWGIELFKEDCLAFIKL